MEKEKIFCKECNTQTNLTIIGFSQHHLKPNHNLTLKEYYDKHIRKEDEGKCLHCGKETTFYGYNKGYAKFCCLKHQQKSDYVRDKIKKSFETRDVKKEANKRKQTCLEKYGVDNIMGVKEVKDKQSNTVQERYGVEHNFLMKSCIKARWKVLNGNKEEINEKRKNFWRNLSEEELEQIIDKRKETFLNKYGVFWNSQLDWVYDKIRKSNEENGRWLIGKVKTDYEEYWSLVRNETLKHRLRVYRLFDGYDYYTGEKLIGNLEFEKVDNRHFNTNPMQPTIDHKISVYYGFMNNIDPKEIGSFNNLCICSRRTNTTKNYLTEKQFMEKLNENKS